MSLKDRLASLRKLIGTALGGATGLGVASLLGGFGVHLTEAAAAAIALALGALGTYLAPPNEQPAPGLEADEPPAA